MPRALLVDDVEEVRTLVGAAMRARGGFEVVAEAGDVNGAIACAEEHQPDLIVLDLGLPDIAGHEVLHHLRVAAPDARIVVFTGTQRGERSLAQSAADALVDKSAEVDYLVDLLEQQSAATADLSATLELEPARTEIRRVRRFVEDRCVAWGCEDRVDDALLVASELATNAALHARTPFAVTVRRRLGAIRLDVLDGSESAPDIRERSDDGEGGRGLYLVSAMSAAWGVDRRSSGGKLVWADLLCARDL